MLASLQDLALFLDCSFDLPFAEVTILPGCLSRKPAELAAVRYRNGETTVVVTTGHWREELGMTEGEAHARVLESLGVPRAAILVEGEASNTFENFAFSVPLVLGHLGRVPSSVRVTGKWHHSRRCLMHAAALLPGVALLSETYAMESVPRFDFERLPGAVAALHKERDRIREWGGTSSMREVALSVSGWRAVH